jgi:hypothetical protein
MIQKILFFSTEPKKSANARERVLFSSSSSSFFILYLFPTSGAGKKKSARAFCWKRDSFSLCVCVRR